MSLAAPLRKLASSPVLWIFALTFIALFFFPIPLCFDCEGPNTAWGMSDHTANLHMTVFEIWSALILLTAGARRIHHAWAVPIALDLALLLTQHHGGVPYWSLFSNEGPVIVIFGLPYFFLFLGLGFILGALID